MNNFKIEIDITDGGLGLKVAPKANAEELMTALFTAQLTVMEQLRTNHPEFQEEIYDQYNRGATSLLEAFIPDKLLRPDITEEALKEMLAAEDKFMAKRVKAVSKKGKKSAKN